MIRRRSLLVALWIAGACVPVALAGADQQAQSALADTERKPLVTIVPDYPAVARRDRIEGEVQVCFEISRSGKPRRIAVRKSTHRLFEKPAMRAVRASTYMALPDDADVPAIKHCRTFRFKLEPIVVETGS
ncbi:MAG: energy transducer TonB [Gammaproteobacteria bacterium]|nr:energy transducer TonB [Gammaproteobacteria bacterium]